MTSRASVSSLRLWFLSLVVALIAGCDPHGAAPPASRDPFPVAGDPLAEDARGGVVARAWSVGAKATAQGLTLGAHLPAQSHGAFDVGLASDEERARDARGDFVVRFVHEAIADVPLEREDGRARYRDVAPSTDLLVTASKARVEWFYALRDAAAPKAYSVHVELPRGLPAVRRSHEGTIDFLDARGKRRLTIPIPYALDARGVRRDATLGWDRAGSRVTIALATEGLTYPILLDPAVEHPVWQSVPITGSPLDGADATMVYDLAAGKTILFGGYTGTSDDEATWFWDGTNWTNTTTTTTPPPRQGAVSAYDKARQRIVLFGGYDDSNNSNTYVNDTWEYDGTNWRAATSTTAPPARSSGSMAYDSVRGKTVLFGGQSYDINTALTYGDTWEWDGTTWTQMAPATAPAARYGAAMVFDAARGKTVLFSGYQDEQTDLPALADTWTWDGTTWTELAPSASPSARAFSSCAYDDDRSQVILFGGLDNNGDALGDVWSWNGTTWQAIASSSGPAARSGAPADFDPNRHVLVLYGGSSSNQSFTDTWEWNGTTWASRSIPTSPSSRGGATMAFDSARGDAVFFGGSSGSAFQDTWLWNGTSWSNPTPATSPGARFEAVSAYDSVRQRVVLFGGSNDESNIFYGLLDDTWEWDGTTWQAIPSANAPPARYNATMVYDRARQVTLLFGGEGFGVTLNDTWEWDGENWTQSNPATSPPVREASAMAYDSARAVTVLFGGRGLDSNGYSIDLADTWEWNGTTWTERMPLASPPARWGSSMAFDAARAKTVLFGGIQSENLNDTWEWDGVKWTSPDVAEPPANLDTLLVYDTALEEIMLYEQGEVAAQALWLYYTAGAACTTTSTCDRGACTDGVCCNAAACGECQSCNLPGSEGTCTNVAAGTVPATPHPNSCAAPNECTAAGVCGGSLGATCAQASDCYSGFCVDGVCCDLACTGDCQACGSARGLTTNGTCAIAPEGTPGRNACGAHLACDGKGPLCGTGCTDDATCEAGYYCAADGSCVAQKSEGAACNDVAGKDCEVRGCRECAVGHCVDGACCGSCQGSAPLGADCTNDAQCAGEHCVGGLCCQSDCSLGDGGTPSLCQAGVCNASLGFVCRIPGTETVCQAEACTKGIHTFVAACDGKGGCGPAESQNCAPFVCGEITCKTTCASDADCTLGATCNLATGMCATAASCSADGTSVISSSGQTATCSPYLCSDSKCATQCASVADCQSGFACDANHTCVANSTPVATPAGGCSCGVVDRRTESRGALVFAAMGALAVLTRRRRRGRASGGAR